nr:mechanosensitive ion channel domain-containing protein [Galliscardovia ingluviei]
MDDPLLWLQAHAASIIFLIIVVAAAALITKATSRMLQMLLDKSHIPSASIFINIVRVLIWVFAAAIVLQPVFGINPTTLVTALGVGGIAVSFGLKDTIANIVSGFGLMLGKVLQPGDLVTIQGVTGTVKDVTWRHTIVIDRSGMEMWVPNSVLNTTALEKLPAANEAMILVPFVARGTKLDNMSIDELAQYITDLVNTQTQDVMLPGNPALVKFTGFSPYGITGNVMAFAKQGMFLSTMQDRVTRALAGQGFLVQDAAGTSDESSANSAELEA